ncbi:MAG: N-6 DNA methylase [Gemmatimonadales bacterium]
MPPARDVAAIIVPQGKLLDFIDNKLRNETPEEYVRQEIEKSLVKEYGYARGEMAVEFRVTLGRSTKRADVVIFPEGVAQKQEHVWAVIECKASEISPNHRQEGIEQLKSYLAACLNAEFGMWTNGQERFCFRKTNRKDEPFVEITDLPVKGRPLDDAERPTFTSLRRATSDSLLFTFRRCHNYIAGNQGLQKPEAFWELLKLIFCKIEDERASQIDFYTTTQERQSLNGQLKVKRRLDDIFARVRTKYESIFRSNHVIELEPRVLAYIVSQLQPWSLLESDIDVKGKAYEEIVGANLRGDRGEFFTPRNICRMAVEMLDPTPEQLVIDPACGTGGFLTIAMNHVIDKIRTAERVKWRNPEQPTAREHEELFRKVQRYANQGIVGIDINPNLVKAAKMNMVLNNDGSGGLYQANALERPVTWATDLRKRPLLGQADLVFTNPPFGSKIPVDDPAILEQYDLAHVWDYDEANDRYYRREPRQLQRSQPPEILFVERCVQLLKPGTGRMAIVLPDGILGSPGLAYVREWILEQTRILASIDLHPDTFQPRNSTQTSILVLERKRFDEIELERAARRKNEYDVFMALANHIGHDKRGNETYVRDEDGNEIVMEEEERVPELRDGTPVYRTMLTKRKMRDDNTGEIATTFRVWLSGLDRHA